MKICYYNFKFKGISILPLIFLSQVLFAQTAKTSFTPAYDSTRNFVGKDVYSLIGQTLFVISKPENLQKYGYRGFVLDYKKDGFPKENTYKCGDNHNSKHDEIAEKHFKILDVFEHPDKHKDTALYGAKYFLKLQEYKSKDILYFEYDSRLPNTFKSVIVMGFYEKQIKESIGKEFIIRGKNWRETIYNENSPLYDIETGEEVKLVPGSIWKVIKLAIETKYCTLSYIIQNENGNKITLDVISAHDSPRRTVYEKEKVKHIIEKHPDYWNKIIEGKVAVGMTEEMVVLSLGAPLKISRTSYENRWVYKDQHLNFENGVVKSFN